MNPSRGAQAGTCCATHLREARVLTAPESGSLGSDQGCSTEQGSLHLMGERWRLPQRCMDGMISSKCVLHTGPEGQTWEKSVPQPLKALHGHWALKQGGK